MPATETKLKAGEQSPGLQLNRDRMTFTLYKTRYRTTLKALFGSAGGLARFFYLHPAWGPLMASSIQQGYQQELSPETAARGWFDHKALPQLADDDLTLESHRAARQAARQAAGHAARQSQK
jgi:hypothetical protein